MKAAQNLLRRFWLETRPNAPLLNAFSSAGLRACKPVRSDTSDAGTEACTTETEIGTEIGRPHPHESAVLHVLGEAIYTDDAPELHGTLHAALGLSEQAHATILSIDLEAVKSAPGIVAVLTATDIPGLNDCGPILHDDPILADGLVQYAGQPIFAVIATSHDLARRAVRLAKIDYATLPAILTPQAARAAESYVLPPMHLQRGDAARALASAPQRVKGTLEVGGQEHFYLEGQVSTAIPKEQHGMLLLCSTQHPSEMLHVVAHALGLPVHNITVECRRMGGGFGGKESQSAQWAAVAAIAAHKLQRPVKLRADRDDDMLVSGKRHCFYYEYEVGFDATGRILAAKVEMVLRAGYSADLSGPVATRAVCHFDNAYYLSEVEIHALCGKTNTQSNTAFRGFGGPQGAIAIEYAIDDIARTLGMDALDVRKINFYGVDDAGGRNVTPYGQKVVDNVIHTLVAELEASSDYCERRAATRSFNAASPVLKKGIALTPVKFGIAFNLTHLNQAGALVHVYLDGSVLVNHGGTEMGQGVNTKVAQVVAHELGIRLAQVRCTATDTSKVANTSATAASTGTDLNGKAAQDAAGQIRTRLATFAAHQYGGTAAEVRFADDVVTSNGHSIAFAALVQSAYLARIQLWSDGFYATPGLHWDPSTMRGNPFSYFCYGAAVSEVIVDTLTGEWKLLRADLLYDVGNSLNPAIDLGQVEGGFIQGMGWLTTEQLWWNKEGKLMTHAPSTYKIPAISDCPEDFRVKLFKNRNVADSIHRSKAAGEPPLLLPFSVFFAIRDAIASVANYRINPPLNAPATSEEILKAVEAVEAVAPLLPLPRAGEGRKSIQ
ncbi:MAG: xanthine dehydrogenase molybdopterin binding subunit [Glaciimonas sp.]|nr:xanthine dehydrogenase molybdopterin binding subunit [Glaciimonas sp.]